MTKFYFLRHGQTDWNLEGRCQGHSDITLNDTGIKQAKKAVNLLNGVDIDLIISSPLLRALQSASIISEAINKPLHIDSQTKERSFGSFEGEITYKIKEAHNISKEESITNILPENAEQWHETLERSNAAINKNLNKYGDKTLLFVSHGAFFRAMHENLTGKHMEAENAQPYLFEKTNEQWDIKIL